MAEYIDREALLQEISKQKAASKHSFPRRSFVVGDVIACIRTAPSADVAPVVHGRWEWVNEDRYRCDRCEQITAVDECMGKPIYDFCPNCGAKMDGDADE